jgi:Tol biopolymer transport system component
MICKLILTATVAFLTAMAATPLMAAETGMLVVEKIVPVLEDGGRVDWDYSGSNRIAVDRPGRDGYCDVWTMDTDGGAAVNLTDGKPGLPNKHNGNPAWHPSGKYIVFQAQHENAPSELDPECQPSAGALNDLWLISADGKQYWKLLEVSGEIGRDRQGVLHPHFSPDGKKLLWSRRLKANDRPFGEWALELADFEMTKAGPKLTNVREIDPGGDSSFFESHSFSPDGKGFLYTCIRDGGPDVYYYDLAANVSRRLTDRPEDWDEHAHFSPGGKEIVWAGSQGLPISLQSLDLKTELWMMYPDGTCQRRLTDFHTEGHVQYLGKKRAAVGDLAWSPEGDRLILFLLDQDPNGPDRGRGGNLMVEFTKGAAFCPLD